MKLAIIAATERGSILAEKLGKLLTKSADIYTKSGRKANTACVEYNSLNELLKEKINVYQGFIFIMAVGIVVRVIAPYIRDKRLDPAIVVMDEKAKNCISMLSGHIGGANELAQEVSSLVGANPVITTATDVNDLPAADVIACKLGLNIEPFELMKTINAKIVNHNKVEFFVDSSLKDAKKYYDYAEKENIVFKDLVSLKDDDYDAAVIISDKLDCVKSDNSKTHLFLRPPTLAVGIGCRRGVAKEDILKVIESAITLIDRSMNSVASLSSTIVKRDERGLLEAAEELAVPIHFYNNEEIQGTITKFNLVTSEFVKKQIGVGNICEAAAILAAKSNKVLLTKTKFNKVTVAIVEVALES